MRFELGNPIGELGHLEKFVLVLEIAGAHPKEIRDDAAKAAESDGGESENGWRVFERLNPS